MANVILPHDSESIQGNNAQPQREKVARLPISLELEIESIQKRITDLQARIGTIHDLILYTPHDAETMYARLWLRYAHEALQGALNSFDGLNKHLTSIGMSITEVRELSVKLAAEPEGGQAS